MRAGAAPAAGAAFLAAATIVFAAFAPRPSPAAVRVVIGDVRAADSIAARPPDRDRDRSLIEWSRKAPLAELMFILRRSPASLGAAETPMLRAALERTGRDRVALRRRLAQRLATADPGRVSSVARDLALGPAVARPGASIFRAALMLPDSGGYDADGRSLRLGLAAGLASRRDPLALPIEIMPVATGDESPDQIAAAFDRGADSAGIVIGAMQPASTAAAATAARALGFPLLSPVAGDERLGAIGPWIFQIGPPASER